MYVKAELIEGAQQTRAVEVVFRVHRRAWSDDPRLWPGVADGIETEIYREGGALGPRRQLASIGVLADDGADIEAWLHDAKDDGVYEHPNGRVNVDLLGAGEASRAELHQTLVAAIVRRLEMRRRYVAVHAVQLKVRDLRGIRELDLTFGPPGAPTVLIGTNGSGKSTILHAVATVLAFAIHEQRGRRPSRVFDPATDIRLGADSAEVWLRTDAFTRDLLLVPSGTNAQPDEPPPWSGQEALRVPLFVLYGTNRNVLDVPVRIRKRHTFTPADANDGALGGGRRGASVGAGIDFRLFFERFREREDLENERRLKQPDLRDAQLDAVRRAIEAMPFGLQRPRVHRGGPMGQRMVVDKTDALGTTELSIEQLSDGEKCFLAMVGDLASRLAMANPYLDDPLTGGGIVLIDEIELHMHPGWQRGVVDALCKTFPNCQFIATTHSPQVIGEVAAQGVRALRVGAQGIEWTQPAASLGLESGRILEDILGVSPRDSTIGEQLRIIGEHLNEGKLEEARSLLGQVEATVTTLDPDVVRLRQLLAFREARARARTG